MRQVCPKCNGDGFVIDRGEQATAAIFTCGVFPIMDFLCRDGRSDSMYAEECPLCEGDKFVYLGKKGD